MVKVSVRVPATSANMGPGFDSFGCALSLYNIYTFEIIEKGLEISGCPEEFCNADNLSIVAYRDTMTAMGLPMDALRMSIHTEIPVCRGLGSSSAMLAAGAMAANVLHGSPLSKEELLKICTRVEGHPDNLAPAIFGGMTASLMRGDTPIMARFPLSEKLRFTALVPDFHLSTELARSILPKEIPFADAVFNISHAALLLRALETADVGMISFALNDRLHQPYRKGLIPGYDTAQQVAKTCGAASFCISGAGPTCLCISDSEEISRKLEIAIPKVLPNWQVLSLTLDTIGCCVVEEKAIPE